MTMIDVIRFKSPIVLDASKPGGTRCKSFNMYRLRALGWQAKTLLSDKAFANFLNKVIA